MMRGCISWMCIILVSIQGKSRLKVTFLPRDLFKVYILYHVWDAGKKGGGQWQTNQVPTKLEMIIRIIITISSLLSECPIDFLILDEKFSIIVNLLNFY